MRNQVVDIAKGLGIVLIVAMHCGYNLVAVTCLPLFFFTSGMFARRSSEKTFSEELLKKTNRLIIPSIFYLVFFSFVAFALTKLNFPGLNYDSLFAYLSFDLLIVRSFLYNPYHPTIMPFAFTLWFLNALWLTSFFWLLFRKFVEKGIISLWGGGSASIHTCTFIL